MKRVIFVLFLIFAGAWGVGASFLEQGKEAYKRGDYKSALELFQKSCESKEGEGCSNLASMYDKGEGVKQDKARAMNLFQKACDNGEMAICILLGIIYEDMGR